MMQKSPSVRLAAPPSDAPPDVADLLDPVALEARLVKARARRAEALARRHDTDHPREEPIPPVPVVDAATTGPPMVQLAAPLTALPRAVADPRGHAPPAIAPTRSRMPMATMFLAGLGLGLGATLAVQAPPSFRERLAGWIAPDDAATWPQPAAETAAPDDAAPAPTPVTTVASPADAPAPSAAATSPEQPAAQHAARSAAPTPDAAVRIAAGLAAPPPFAEVALPIDAPTPLAAAPSPAQPEAPGAASAALAAPAPDAAVHVVAVPVSPTRPAVDKLYDLEPPATPTVASPSAVPPAATPGTAPEDVPALAGGTRVFVHHLPGARPAAEAAASRLRQAGLGEVTIIAAPHVVSRTNVRFFHETDVGAARDVAALLAAAGGAAPEIRDFTDFSPPPRPGMVELWLAGDVPAAAPRRSPTLPAPMATAQASPATPPAGSVDIRRLVEEVVRDRATMPPLSAKVDPQYLKNSTWFDREVGRVFRRLGGQPHPD